MSEGAEAQSGHINPVYPWQQHAWQYLLQQHGQQQLAHAYLVCGEQGIGKFHLIQNFAKYLFCKSPANDYYCGHCVNCQLNVNGNHPDILLLEPAAGARDIKVDQVRNLSEFVSRTTHSGICKLALINHAHQLNISAANSLLKTLEEPSSNTFLFLISERAGALPATLRSRCQRLLLSTPPAETTVSWLRSQGIAANQAQMLTLAAGNRPLHAMALARHDGISNAQDFMLVLTKLLRGSISTQAAVVAALKLDEKVAVEYLSTISSIVSRQLLTGQSSVEQPVDDLIAAFRVTAKNRPGLSKDLLLFAKEAESALGQLRSSTNPNPQLLLESLLWQWHQLSSNRSLVC